MAPAVRCACLRWYLARAEPFRRHRVTSMNKKKTLLIGAALLLAVAPAHAEILVGFVTGLSGPVSSIGVPNAKGLAAGQAHVGEIDGEKVRVIQLDDGSDPAASTRNARKLVEQEKVDFLIGTSGAPQT